MKLSKKVFYLIALIILTLGCWLTAYFYFGSMTMSFGGIIGLAPVWLVIFAILSWLFTKGLALGAKKVNVKVWIFVGLLILFGWFLPASTLLLLFPAQGGEPFGFPLAFTLLVIISLSLIIIALLINSGLQLYIAWRIAETAYYKNTKTYSRHTSKAVAAIFILSALLLARAFYKFYWFMVWDSTTDGLGYLWLPIPILAVLSSAILLYITLPDGMKVGALIYFLLVPILIAISTHPQQLEFRQMTEKRAERVSQALDAYYVRKGHYPQNLQQLTPRHIISIPGPVIIYGQDWCYDGGNDYYRLGYVDREHWSSPYLFGQTFRTWGEVPDLPAICEQEAITLIESRSNTFWTFDE